MSSQDFHYYRKRIADEHARAAQSPTPEIAAVHEKLAHLYESLTERLQRSPSGQDVSPPTPDAQQTR